MVITLPKRKRGRQSATAEARYQEDLDAFCEAILQIDSKSYLAQFGARKVEANALVVRAEAGRELCRQAILKYVPEDEPRDYQARLKSHQHAVRDEVYRQLEDRWGSA